VIYAERKRVLSGEDVHDHIMRMMDETVAAYVDGATGSGYAEEWDLEQLWSSLRVQLYPVGISVDEVIEEAGGTQAIDADFLKQTLVDDIHAAYARREEELTEPVLHELERLVLLDVLDRKWREHLYEMDYLRDGVGLRAYAQRDPLVEYNREGFDMFQQMLDGVREETVGFLFKLEVQAEQPTQEPVAGVGAAPRLLGRGLARPQPQQLQFSAPSIDGASGRGETPVLVQEAPVALRSGSRPDGARPASAALPNGASRAVGVSPGSPGAQAASKRPAAGQAVGSAPSRNAPCPCGSGKKYKHCHGAPNAV
jgi:preprotein translocase subunit SecA